MKLCMAGIDHVSAALEQREKLSLVRGQVQAVLPRIAERTGCAAEVLCEATGASACRPFPTGKTPSPPMAYFRG